MQSAHSQHPQEEPASVYLATITKQDRTRLSGAGLRTFGNIVDLWELTESERLSLLGEPARSTFYAWMKKALNKESLTLPLDTLLRISAVIGIHKSLTILFYDQQQALLWLKSEHRGTVFSGMPPLTLIVEGAHDGITSVRRYLDAWRGGHTGHGAQEGTFEPVTEDDIVFI